MPAAAQFRSRCVAELWNGLRFADARARRRMMEDAEAFLADLEADSEYPDDFVIERVTRYRPERISLGALTSGASLIHDITAFILRTSRRDPLSASIRGGALRAEEVMVRLQIASRTLARFRSSGLVMHHLQWSDGGVRVGCFEDALQRFMLRSAPRVLRATKTVRMKEDDRELLIRRAVSICEKSKRTSLHALATQLSPIIGCSVRSARTALESSLEVRNLLQGSAITAQLGRVRMAGKYRRNFAVRANSLGFSPQQIAAHASMSIAAVTRSVLRERRSALRALLHANLVSGIPLYEQPEAVAALLASKKVCSGLPVGGMVIPEPHLGPRAPMRSMLRVKHAVLSDVAQLRAFRFLVWRSCTAAASWSATPLNQELDAVERDLRWAYRLQRAMVESALPSALTACVQYLGVPWISLPVTQRHRWAAFTVRESARAIAAGALSQLKVEEVRPTNLALHAVTRAIARDGGKCVHATDDGVDAADNALRRSVPWWHIVCSADGWVEWLPDLDAAHRRMIIMRFGLDGQPPRLFTELSKELRTSDSLSMRAWYAAMASLRHQARSKHQ